MKNIRIKLFNEDVRTLSCEDNENVIAVLKRTETPYPIYACRINHRNSSLKDIPENDDLLELLDIRDAYVHNIYQESLCLLYAKAVHDILGDVEVVIANSITKGLFTQIRNTKISRSLARKIEKRMRQLVHANLPFAEKDLSPSEVSNYCEENHQGQYRNLFRSLKEIPSLKQIALENETGLYTSSLLPSTSYLRLFELRAYRTGILLRFPHPHNPSQLPAYEPQYLLYKAFSEETRWGKNIGVEYAADLNNIILDDKGNSLILLAEALHEKEISEIATTIAKQKKRLILIAGPSSSGKTSFAKRLEIGLRVRGLHPLYIGTDDYFKERTDTPLLENGEKDYESIRAIDTSLFGRHLQELLDGKEVDIPRYDFYEGKKKFQERVERLEKNQPIIIEGIHALNPELVTTVAADDQFRIYISPLTQLNIDPHKRVSTSDARLLRRILRDNRTRGYKAEETIYAWPKVREGEERYIFPYSDRADCFFNSSTIYELAVLKKEVKPLLEEIPSTSPIYGEARRLLSFLAFFNECEDTHAIPSHSLLREFIGGSVLVK